MSREGSHPDEEGYPDTLRLVKAGTDLHSATSRARSGQHAQRDDRWLEDLFHLVDAAAAAAVVPWTGPTDRFLDLVGFAFPPIVAAFAFLRAFFPS